mmetsp:Transcript_9877/g.26329  ORF Transcript_9877/g.26329 Transcript_9877/m.26329 type:complete len:256 (+) Transcript_9877:202-969(+)
MLPAVAVAAVGTMLPAVPLGPRHGLLLVAARPAPRAAAPGADVGQGAGGLGLVEAPAGQDRGGVLAPCGLRAALQPALQLVREGTEHLLNADELPSLGVDLEGVLSEGCLAPHVYPPIRPHPQDDRLLRVIGALLQGVHPVQLGIGPEGCESFLLRLQGVRHALLFLRLRQGLRPSLHRHLQQRRVGAPHRCHEDLSGAVALALQELSDSLLLLLYLVLHCFVLLVLLVEDDPGREHHVGEAPLGVGVHAGQDRP